MSESAPPSAYGWLQRFFRTVHVHLILPFLQTHDPLPLVARGASVGVLVGLTPTVGFQMYLVTMIWFLCRYVFRFRFNFTIAVAMVWISHPITMIPLYYLFLMTGDWFRILLGYPVAEMSFQAFQAAVVAMSAGEELNWFRWLFYGTAVLMVQFGWPIVLGSLVYAVPLGTLSYPFTYVTLRRYRRYLAEAEGLSYAEWRRRYEAPEP